MKRVSNVRHSFDIIAFVKGYEIGQQVNYSLLTERDQKRLQRGKLVQWSEIGTLIICKRIK